MGITAVIGGSGLYRLDGLCNSQTHKLITPYGEPSCALLSGTLNGCDVIFISRHGEQHHIPPHKINYRANIWALKESGVENIIAVAAVGGITSAMKPSQIVIPDQLIDYTYGREHSFYNGNDSGLQHINFTSPYSRSLRQVLISAADRAKLEYISCATYAATQGPRLETSAEIRRLENDGCDIVGMTGMPEASLARELGISYASVAVVANWAAGKSSEEITMHDIRKNLDSGMHKVISLLIIALQALA